MGLRHTFQIFFSVKWFCAEPFIGSPDHFFLIIRTFEVDFDFVEPFLSRRCNEVREKLFFTICHSYTVKKNFINRTKVTKLL